MQIRKTYYAVNPNLLFDQLQDFILKRGLTVAQHIIETYPLPENCACFMTRGTLIFNNPSGATKECIRVNMVGSASTITKLLMDIDEECLSPEQIAAFQSEMDFMFADQETPPE